MRRCGRNRVGFTLVELLVVIGLIAMLIAMLLPAVTRARLQAVSVSCQTRMRDVGMSLNLYAQENRGFIFPVGELIEVSDSQTGLKVWVYDTLGIEGKWENVVADPAKGVLDKNKQLRWPNYVFKDGAGKPVWNPIMLICPSDLEPAEDHTYILNKHLATKMEKLVKLGTRVWGRSDSDIVVMGEKKSSIRDYYMEFRIQGGVNEFDRIVEPYRHGIKLGSNYLYLDWHVSLVPPQQIQNTLDSWDFGMNKAEDIPPDVKKDLEDKANQGKI